MLWFLKKAEVILCSGRKIQPVFQANELVREGSQRLLTPKQEWMNMYQLLYLQSKLQPAPDCRGTREGRGGCPAAVCRRKCLHKFESDRKSFFNITLFFHHVYRGGKKTTYREFSVLSPTQKVGWRWQSSARLLQRKEVLSPHRNYLCGEHFAGRCHGAPL